MTAQRAHHIQIQTAARPGDADRLGLLGSALLLICP